MSLGDNMLNAKQARKIAKNASLSYCVQTLEKIKHEAKNGKYELKLSEIGYYEKQELEELGFKIYDYNSNEYILIEWYY